MESQDGQRSEAADLESLREGFKSLCRTIAEQQGAISSLKRELAACRLEVSTIHDCLVNSGNLDEVGFLVQLHRRNFANSCAMHGLQLEASFERVIDARAVALLVGLFAAPRAMRRLREASKSLSLPVNDVRGHLSPGHVYVCGGFEGALALSSVERFDPLTGVWEALPPMMEARQYTCSGVINGRIFVCGGWGGPQPVRSVERFDPARTLWEQMPPMLNARWGASAGVVGGKLHICGGLDESRSPLSSVERFDPRPDTTDRSQAAGASSSGVGSAVSSVSSAPVMQTTVAAMASFGLWEAVAAMSERRGWPAVGVLAGVLYVCGGRDEQREPLSSVERLSPSTEVWASLSPMAGQRAGAAAAAAGGRLYVCGGAFGAQMLNSAEVYDPKADVWMTLHTMSARRAYVTAATVAGRLHVFGGSDGRQCLGTVEKYDPDADTWEQLPTMSERRSGAAAGAVVD